MNWLAWQPVPWSCTQVACCARAAAVATAPAGWSAMQAGWVAVDTPALGPDSHDGNRASNPATRPLAANSARSEAGLITAILSGCRVSGANAVAGTPCNDKDPCTVQDKCAVGGKCQGGQPVACPDDGNPCTIAACDPAAGKGECSTTKKAPGEACNDGNPCTTDDTCDSSASCNGNALTCVDDGNPCTAEFCDSVKGCSKKAQNDGAACDDGNPLTKTSASAGCAWGRHRAQASAAAAVAERWPPAQCATRESTDYLSLCAAK